MAAAKNQSQHGNRASIGGRRRGRRTWRMMDNPTRLPVPSCSRQGALSSSLGMMVAIVAIKPLEYKPPVACAEESCAHEGTAPVAPEHEAPPPASGAHAPHGE